MIDQVEEMLQAVLQSQILTLSAQTIKRYVEELEAAGFSHEDAIELAKGFKAVGS